MKNNNLSHVFWAIQVGNLQLNKGILVLTLASVRLECHTNQDLILGKLRPKRHLKAKMQVSLIHFWKTVDHQLPIPSKSERNALRSQQNTIEVQVEVRVLFHPQYKVNQSPLKIQNQELIAVRMIFKQKRNHPSGATTCLRIAMIDSTKQRRRYHRLRVCIESPVLAEIGLTRQIRRSPYLQLDQRRIHLLHSKSTQL